MGGSSCSASRRLHSAPSEATRQSRQPPRRGGAGTWGGLQLRVISLAGPTKFTLRSEATKGQRSRGERQGQQKCRCCRVVRSVGVSCTRYE